MSGNSQVMNPGQVGYRFAIGSGLIVCGYAALALVPMVAAADLTFGLKTALTGLISTTPLLTKIAAIAVMGKAGFNFLKEHIFNFFLRFRPVQRVSPLRYRTGLILFLLPVAGGWLEPFAPGLFVDWSENKIFWSLFGDAILITGLFVLGGEFWDKLKALFMYNARVLLPEDASA
jgi:hypothetical protein